jgi:hypothetical protein
VLLGGCFAVLLANVIKAVRGQLRESRFCWGSERETSAETD